MEREPQITSSFILRIHHLGILEDFLPDFYKFSEGKKPWEFASDNFYKLVVFAKEYASMETEKDLAGINDFETSIIESETAEEDYLYLIDLIGTTKEDVDKVLEGRTKFFTDLLEVAFNGRQNEILLIADLDGYCKSCAIGKHCHDKSLGRVNTDLVYREALERLVNDFRVRRDEKEKLIITMDTFFDPAFYAALRPLAKEIFLRELKSLDKHFW